MECECGTNAEIYGGWKEVLMLRDPFFLFRAAEADPHEIGTAVTNHIRDARGFICWPSAEGWRVRSDDGGVRKFFPEVGL